MPEQYTISKTDKELRYGGICQEDVPDKIPFIDVGKEFVLEGPIGYVPRDVYADYSSKNPAYFVIFGKKQEDRFLLYKGNTYLYRNDILDYEKKISSKSHGWLGRETYFSKIVLFDGLKGKSEEIFANEIETNPSMPLRITWVKGKRKIRLEQLL